MLVAEIPAAVALAEVAAQAAHVADLRPADVASGFAERREMPPQIGMLRNGRQLRAGADGGLLFIGADPGQGTDTGDADHAARLSDIFLLQVVQIGAARQELGIAPTIFQERHGLLGGGRTEIGEVFHRCYSLYRSLVFMVSD